MYIIRSCGLYAKYLLAKIKYRGKVHFYGFTVVYSFPGFSISINSSPLSNLAGLFQRTIIVARHGNRIDIGENTKRNGKIT